MSYDINEIEQRYSYINEQNTAAACSVFGEVCLELSHKTKTNFPPSSINNLSPKILELAKKFNKKGFLSSLIESGQLSLPVEQKAVLQVLERMNINYELYLDKKKEALQNSIDEQKELVQELMEMSEKGHKQLIEMLIDLEEFFAKYYKLDKLRQEIKDLERELEFIREQLQIITRTLKEIAEELAINEVKLNNIIKIINVESLLLQAAKDNCRQKYEETIRGFVPAHAQKLTDAFIKLEIDSSTDNIQDYKKELKVFSNTISTHNELQNTDAILNSDAVGKSIVEFKGKLAILAEQLKQNLGGLEQSQEKIVLCTEEMADLEKQIAEAEEKKNGFDEQIKTFSDKKADLASKLTKLKEISGDSSQIKQLTTELTNLTSKEARFKEKKAQLIEQIEPLEQQKEKLEQQQIALNKEKEIKQKIAKEKEKEIAIIKINAREKISSKTQVNDNKVR